MMTIATADKIQPLWKSPIGLGLIAIYFMLATFLAIPSMKALDPVDQYYNNIYGSAVGMDFRVFYTAGKLARDKDFTGIYDEKKLEEVWRKDFNVTRSGEVHFSYPPLTLMVWAPLSTLSYPVALSIWIGVPFLMIMGLVYRLTRSYLVLAATIFSPLFLYSALTGQTGYLMTLFLAGGLLCLDNKKYILAGIVFAFLSFKPHLAVAIPLCLLLTQQWKTIASGIITLSLIIALSCLVLGTEPWIAFYNSFGQSLNSEYSPDGVATAYSLTLWNIFLNITGNNIVATSIHILGAIIAIGLTVYTWKNTHNFIPRLLTLAILPAFISPYFHALDLAPLIIVFAIMLKDMLYKEHSGRALVIIVIVWVFGFITFKAALYVNFIIPLFFIVLFLALAPLLTKDEKDEKSALS